MAINWTHPSVVRTLEAAGADDPIRWVENASRDLSLDAMENGWEGPPYDSLRLAALIGVEVVAMQDLDDARLVSAGDRPRIEFNPSRRPARVRFSIAHEIGHLLFDDYAEHTRYRNAADRRSDDWQLEMLCNVAAAELLMPAGALPIRETKDLSLVRLLDQRQRFGVSTEALLRRAVRLADTQVCVFAAARVADVPTFRIDYVAASRNWQSPVRAGDELSDTVLARCTAVGYSDHAIEEWRSVSLQVQAVGVPPYPGDRFPRVVGLLMPADSVETHEGIHYVRGDASQPQADAPVVIAHVVNDAARCWGGQGFARALLNRFPDAGDQYAGWPFRERSLGEIHVATAADGVWIASMLAQVGFGPREGKRRLRIHALQKALRSIAQLARQEGAEVHMPPIGTGQGGAEWPTVRDLVLEEVVSRGVPVTVYVLPEAQMLPEALDAEQLALL